MTHVQKGHGFESLCWMLDGHLFTLICYKNCIVCFKRPKINEKRPELAHFKKNKGRYSSHLSLKGNWLRWVHYDLPISERSLTWVLLFLTLTCRTTCHMNSPLHVCIFAFSMRARPHKRAGNAKNLWMQILVKKNLSFKNFFVLCACTKIGLTS